MNLPKSTNEYAAERKLLDEYERVSGKSPDEMVRMICSMSAARARTQEWEWQKSDNPNWPIQLNWK